VLARLEAAFGERDGVDGAHCIHELWMRNEPPLNIERLLGLLWRAAPESVPEWLPMRYVDWLPLAYEVAARFERQGCGRSNLYLVLLDYEDSPRGPTACTSARRNTRRRCASTSTKPAFARRAAY